MGTLEVFGLMFDLQPNGRKCLREEVQKDVLVTGDYEISEVAGQRTDLKVIDSKGHTLSTTRIKTKGSLRSPQMTTMSTRSASYPKSRQISEESSTKWNFPSKWASRPKIINRSGKPRG